MIGTHAGRSTFICFALSSGIPPQVVMKWTWHSNYQAMKPYISLNFNKFVPVFPNFIGKSDFTSLNSNEPCPHQEQD